MLKSIESLKNEFPNAELAKKKLRSVQSLKSRLKKQKGRNDYNEKMTAVLEQEQSLKELVDWYEPKRVMTTKLTDVDIKELNYDETLKAIKSIQSKKCNSQHDIDQSEYENAIIIEEKLLQHKENIKPIEDTVVKKSDIRNLIDHMQKQDEKIDKEYIIELLEKML